jgi:Domain of unknown function (DUF4382)
MGRDAFVAKAAVSRWALTVPAVFLCALVSGCDNSCFIFVSNPSGGTLAVTTGTGTCHVSNQPVSNVRIRFVPPAERTDASGEAGIRHLFVTVREIDAHLGLAYGEDSSGWQDLTPNLGKQPLQIDLMSVDDGSAPAFLGQAAVPAGEYTQFRILLGSDRPPASRTVPAANACAEVGFNCLVTEDGDVRPLVLPTSEQANDGQTSRRITRDRILIPPAQPGGAVFRVFPGTISTLDLSFDPAPSQLYMLGSAAWFRPSFVIRCDLSPANDSSGPSVAPGSALAIP